MTDTITIRDGHATSFDGRGAVEVYRLATLISALKLEIACPGMKAVRGGALKVAKQITGLRTNDRAKHIAAVEKMLAEAKAAVQYVTT